MGNIFWGLPSQFGWQFATGRLKGFPNTKDCQDEFCVSYNSWWASINYYLSVVPFLGAVNAGIIEVYGYKIKLASSRGRSDQYCTGVKACQLYVPDAMADWTKFFEVLKKESSFHGNTESIKVITFDALLGLMWDAHLSSIHSVAGEFEPVLVNYSTPEKTFGKGWGHIVDYLGASRFNTNLTNTDMYQKQSLPKRVLENEDHAPFIDDMTKYENFAIAAIQTFYFIDLHTGMFRRLAPYGQCN